MNFFFIIFDLFLGYRGWLSNKGIIKNIINLQIIDCYIIVILLYLREWDGFFYFYSLRI